jgi:AraC-like DNA-binding protein
VGFAQHDSDWNWKNVRSPFARLYYVTDGEAEVCIGVDNYTLTPGHLYLIPAFAQHNCVCKSKFAHYYIHIYEDQTGAGILDEYNFPVEVEASSSDLCLIRRLCELNPFLKLPESNPVAYDNHHTLVSNVRLHHQSPLHNKMESRGILYISMSRFFKFAVPKEDVADSRINQTINYIRRHLDSRIDLETLAGKACMSKDHFIRVFKRETGDTPNAYITKRKIDKAQLALITTDYSIKAIAKMFGYNDHSYFNRLFKQFTGTTPQGYRTMR